MPITARQQRALDKAPRAARQQMRQNFERQTRAPPRPLQRTVSVAPRTRPVRKRHSNIYNAFSRAPFPLVGSTSRAVGLTGFDHFQVDSETTTTGKVVLCLFNACGSTSSFDTGAAMVLTGVPDGTSVPAAHVRGKFDQLGALTDVCDTVLPCAGSLRIRNVTPRLDHGGTVRVCKLPSGTQLAGNPGGPDFAALVARIRGDVTTVPYDGVELAMPHRIDQIPSRSAQPEFINLGDATSKIPVFTAIANEPNYGIVALLFEPCDPDHRNSYEIGIAGKYYGRFHTMTALANMATHPPTIPLATQTTIRDAVEAVGCAMVREASNMGRAAAADAAEVALGGAVVGL